MDLFALATVPAGPDEARRTATFKFYELRDNLRRMRSTLLSLVALLTLALVPSAHAAGSYVKLDAPHALGVYPSAQAPQSAALSAGTVAEVKGRADADGQAWLRLSARGKTGWTTSRGTHPVSAPTVGPNCKQQRSRSIGAPGNGRLTGAVLFPAAGEDFFAWSFRKQRVGQTTRTRWATCRTVRAVLSGIAAYRGENPDAPAVAVGDFSLRHGGRIDGHSTHQNGKQVDLYFPRRDKKRMEPHTVAQVDQRLTRSLVRHMLKAGARKALIGQNTKMKTSSRVVRWPHHDDHTHLIF